MKVLIIGALAIYIALLTYTSGYNLGYKQGHNYGIEKGYKQGRGDMKKAINEYFKRISPPIDDEELK